MRSIFLSLILLLLSGFFFLSYVEHYEECSSTTFFLISVGALLLLFFLNDRRAQKKSSLDSSISSSVPGLWPTRYFPRMPEFNWRIELLLAGPIFLVGAASRIWYWYDIPPGIWIDELYAAANIARVLEGELPLLGTLPLIPDQPDWVHTFNLYSWFGASLFTVAGNGFLGTKLLSIVPSTLSLLALYWVLRELGGKVLALSGLLLLSTNFIHLAHSRVDWDVTFLFLLSLLGLASLIRGIRYNTLFWVSLSGVLFGISQFTYVGSRLHAVGVAGGLIALLILGQRRSPGFRKRMLRIIAVWFISLTVSAMPVIGFSTKLNTQAAASRIKQVGIINFKEWTVDGERLKRRIGEHLEGFYLKGPGDPKHNIPHRPLLPIVLTLLAGLGACLQLFSLRRGIGHSLIWFLFSCALLNGILTRGDAVTAQRVGLAVILSLSWAAYALWCVTYGLSTLVEKSLSEREGPPSRALKYLAPLLATCLLLAVSAVELKTYVQHFGPEFNPKRRSIGGYRESRLALALEPYLNDYTIVIDQKLQLKEKFLKGILWPSQQLSEISTTDIGHGTGDVQSFISDGCKELGPSLLIAAHPGSISPGIRKNGDCVVDEIRNRDNRLLFLFIRGR